MCLAARYQGQQHGTPSTVAALLPDESCTAPCWRGLRPAVISDDGGTILLNELPGVEQLNEYTWKFEVEGQEYYLWYLQSLTLLAPHVRLGDILVTMGIPDYQKTQIAVNLNNGNREQLIYLYYEKQQVIVLVSAPLDGRISVEMPLAAFEYPSQYYARPYYVIGWQGAIWLKKYP